VIVDPNTFIYVCGLKSMEEGMLAALRDIASGPGFAWEPLADPRAREGRLHLETY